MRGKQPVVVEALRVRAVPESSCYTLLEFLRLYRDVVQLVVNEIWGSNEKLSKKKLYDMFYDKLRKLGFRAHHAKQIYTYAKSIVDSAKSNSGKRPVLRKLTARVDRYDYRLELDNATLTLKLHGNYEIKLKLLTSKERVEKFRGWSNYELVVKYENGELWVSIYFKRVVKPVRNKTVAAIDLNFDNLTLAVFTLSGKLVRLKRFKTPLRKVLTHRIWVERIQKRYSESWRFVKGVRNSIERHGERIRSIYWDYAHKISDIVAELALRHRSIVVLEELEGFRENSNKGREFNKKLALWFYRRVQFCAEYEARERGLEVARVSPKGTSSKCPKCSSKLADSGYRILRCSKCNYIGDRDVVATINLCRRFSSRYPRCGGPGVLLNTPQAQ